MTAVWIGVGGIAFIGLVALWGWYRHKLELEHQQLGAMLLRVQARRPVRG